VDELTPTTLEQYLFMAGVGMELEGAPDMFHATGRLTIGLPVFSFNVHADAWVLSSSWEQPSTAQADIWIDQLAPGFGAEIYVDMGFPVSSVMRISGSMGLYVGKDDIHIDIGWPYPEYAVSGELLSGALYPMGGVHITPTGTRVCMGTGFNYWVFKGSINGDFGYDFAHEPYLVGSIWASGEVNFIVASIGASASLSAALYHNELDFSGTFSASINMPWPLPDLHPSVNFSGSI
jgi:hypothetical protein